MIDSWPGPSGEYDLKKEYEEPNAFMNSLPYLRCFGGLTALHLCFKNLCRENGCCMCVKETRDMRYKMLKTMCNCVAGVWTR